MKHGFFAFLIIILFSCVNNEKTKEEKQKPDPLKSVINKAFDHTAKTDTLKPTSEDSIDRIARKILIALKNKDYTSFANYFHPNEPVLFSPYIPLNRDSCQKLSEIDFLEYVNEDKALNWGNYDESHKPIKLKVNSYFERFVYDADYINSKKPEIEHGNSYAISRTIEHDFGDLKFATYYVNHFNKKYKKIDFKSLRLGFKKHQNQYYLAAVIHDRLNPLLKLPPKKLASKNYKIGNYIIKATATKKYEEIGYTVIPVLSISYKVNSQTINYVNHNILSNSDIFNLKPNYRLQKDSSLIFLITNETVKNSDGYCGACTFLDSEFWLVKRNSKKLIFSFSSIPYNSCSVTYKYDKLEGGFSLEDDLNKEACVELEKAYWKNNNTYVFQITNVNLSRKYYLHFNANKAELKMGELYRPQ